MVGSGAWDQRPDRLPWVCAGHMILPSPECTNPQSRASMRTIVLLAAFAVLVPSPSLWAQEDGVSGTVTTLEGVFTDGQVERGEGVFKDACLACHDTFEFVESGYMNSWAGQPMLGLYEYVSTMMPDDNPGSLRKREYAEVFAYLFHLNGMPTGETRLEGDAEVLRRIIIMLPESTGQAPRPSGGIHR